MRRLVPIRPHGGWIAPVAALPATANPRGSNGLIAFTHGDCGAVSTINPDGSDEQQLFVGGESGGWSPDGARLALFPDCCGGGSSMPTAARVSAIGARSTRS
jgi:hypothetical protein